MRIAHISDLHLVGLEPIRLSGLLNKRVTGYLNLRLRRSRRHMMEVAHGLLADLRAQSVDHVVVTGDLTNLALPSEFNRARDVIRDELGATPDTATIVPGNHDLYTRGAAASQRFFRRFETYLRSDLPDFRARHESGAFPVVKLRGPLALIGLSTAVARPPFFASGAIGRPQLGAMRQLLSQPAVCSLTPVFILHHPPENPRSLRKRIMNGLDDALELLSALAQLQHGVVLHGHLHRRIHRTIQTDRGQLEVFGASSLSLVDPDPSKMAGYNLYDFDGQGRIRSASARVYDPETRHTHTVEIDRS